MATEVYTFTINSPANQLSGSGYFFGEEGSPLVTGVSGTINGVPIDGLSTFRNADNSFVGVGGFRGRVFVVPSDAGISFDAGGISYNIRRSDVDPLGTYLTTSLDPNTSVSPGFVGYYDFVVCFVAGTAIRTDRGETPIERLKVGDLVVTASGERRPVRWIGCTLIDCTAASDPCAVQPIRITAGSVGMGQPARDLLVSPDHCILFDDVLIPAKHLTNGATIRQEPVASVEYWHVELDRHDALLAEGLPAESYRDCGMGGFFDEGRTWGVRAVGGEPAPQCAPHVLSGPRLHRVKEWLIARARHLGAQCHNDPALALVADGRPLAPVSTQGRRFTFDVPEGTRELVLRSRVTLASHWISDNEDRRQLGVRVSDLRIDGEPVPMTDGRLARGWNPVETNGAERWTKGAAHLPIGRRVSFEADWFLPYPAEIEAVPLARAVNG